MRVRRFVTVAALAASLVPAAAARGAFPQDPPNDPLFAAAERSCATTSVNDEQAYLYSTLSRCTPLARDPENAAGMSVDSAWKRYGIGKAPVAYVEGGINWFSPTAKDLVDQVYLNARELPPPTTPVDDGHLNVKDYADTTDANGNGYVDPEDLIVRFSDGKDSDGNGYVDDISGWDFYDNQNDPATTDGAYLHSDNQMRQVGAEADNGLLGAGVCPGCQIIPVKAGAEALDRTDDLAQAWLFAADAGAKVIVSVTADLGYSTFMDQAVKSLWRRGVVMVEASNDFDSTDHQGGMFHPHVIPGNGLVPNTRGIPGPEANALTTTFRARSGETSWGTKSFTSVATQGGSTSTSTPTTGGVFALTLSARDDLTGPEAVQVVRATASDVDDPTSNWPSKPGFDLQFGYGRPNVLKAMKAAYDGDIPPVGWIDKPDWYELFDPTRTRAVSVTGHAEARRAKGYRWTLQVAPGAEPTDADFSDVGSGGGSAPYDGTLATVDLSKLPPDFATRAFALSKTKTLETNEQYTVTLRLRINDDQGRVGEDRRTIAVHHDPTWRDGFPKRVGPGGEAQAQLYDLQGTGRLAAIFGDSDGVVHAIDGVSGEELAGWPVPTDATKITRPHAGVDPGHEPVVANAAIGDLDGDGRPSVVVTSSTGRTYIFDADGARRQGWPRTLDTGVTAPEIPRRRRDYTRLPARGAFAPPVLVDLDSDGRLDVVQSGWDGRIHAWDAAGHDLAGWPVEVRLPAGMGPDRGLVRVDDHKLDTPPAVADLDGDGKPELVQRTQLFDTRGDEVQPAGVNYVAAYRADGTPMPGWPRRLPALFVYYGSAQEFITEGSTVPSVADIGGAKGDEVAVRADFSPTSILSGDGSTARVLAPVPDATLGLATNPKRLLSGGIPADAPIGFTTSGAFGRIGGRGLGFAEPGSGTASIAGAILTPGSGLPIKNVVRETDPATGAAAPGFPADTQGLDFLGAPVIADVDGDGEAEVIEGGDSSALHGFAVGGAQASGFPKFTTGWVLYAPAVGDVTGDGRVSVVALTREGYLMQWRTPGLAAGDGEWWSYRHDDRNTSNYATDSRPPGAPRDLGLDGSTFSLSLPGDDWYAGATKEVIVRARGMAPRTVPAAGPAGTMQTVSVPRIARRVIVRARDDAGNLGAAVTLARAGAPPPCASRRIIPVTLPPHTRTYRVTIRGRVMPSRRRGRKVAVSLVGRPKGRFAVRITARTAKRTVRFTRRYRTCVPRPRG